MSREVIATCPCCGHLVFDEPPGSYAICPICFWEDDEVQLRFPKLRGGANAPSLIEAQRNFRQCGACEQRFTGKVRRPIDKDKDLSWRPVDSNIDKVEEPFTSNEEFTPYPEDYMTLYYWNENYWRRNKPQ